MTWRIPFAGGRERGVLTPAPSGRRGMVLVHGFGCNNGIWCNWQRRLEVLNIPCIAVNLTPHFTSISDYVPIIDAAVTKLQGHTGMAPVIVGHSMGGLAGRAWWAQQPDVHRAHRLLTISSPHQGTVMARFGSALNTRQMRPGSTWLLQLRAQETPAHVQRVRCLFSDCDNMVLPSAAAALPGADNRLIPGCGHVALVDHPAVFSAALHSLREANSD